MANNLTPVQALADLRKKVEAEGLTAFCRNCKTSVSYVSNIVNGEKPPGSKAFERFGYTVLYRSNGKPTKTVSKKKIKK